MVGVRAVHGWTWGRAAAACALALVAPVVLALVLSSRVKSWKYEPSVTGAMLCPYSRTAERGHRIVAGLQLDRYLRQDSLATRIGSASPFSATSRGASSSTAPAVRAVSSLATISPAPAVAAMRAAVCTPSPR